MLPNFLICGAEKAGTTSLAAMLAQHPQIFMCEPKEPRYFSDHNWDKGLAWYESLFDDAEGYKAVGEASPAYTWGSDEVPKRIYETLGDIKYIYIIRDPVERLISHYRHAKLYGWIEPDCGLEEALEQMPQLKDGSRYWYQLEKYLPYTDKEQWLVLRLESLIADTKAMQKQIFTFLDCEPDVDIELPMENVGDGQLRSPQWAKKMQGLKAVMPESVQQLARSLLGEKAGREDIGADMRARLRQEFERDDGRLQAEFKVLHL